MSSLFTTVAQTRTAAGLIKTYFKSSWQPVNAPSRQKIMDTFGQCADCVAAGNSEMFSKNIFALPSCPT